MLAKGINGNGFGHTLGSAAQLAHWITPQTHDERERGNTNADHHHSPHDLSNQVHLAPWPTTTKQDAIGSARHGYMNDGKPRAATNQRRESLTGHAGTTLTDAARLASWATPAARDSKGANSELHVTVTGGGQEAHGPASESGCVAYARDERCERGEGDGREAQRWPQHAGGERGPCNGFWGNAEWLACIDGKARAVEPGTFPLAHGAPARVGRLRAYGNAIVAPVAAEFIGAYIDSIENGETP